MKDQRPEEYTKTNNKVLDELVKTPLLGAEYACALLVVRKTWGFGKEEDEISLSQFEKATGRTRPTIVKALKNLLLVKVLILVKKGDTKHGSNRYKVNRNIGEWHGLVNVPELVKGNDTTSKIKRKKLVKTPKHTKDNTKENTKEPETQAAQKAPKVLLQGEQWNELIDGFAPVNPMFADFYRMKTQRSALQDIVNVMGYEKTLWVVLHLRQATSKPYAPKITTPMQLRNKLGELQTYWEQEKAKGTITNNKSRGVA